MGKFVVKKKKGGLRFNLKAANGEVVGVSEVYTAEDSCMNGIASVRKNAVEAKLEDQTVADFTPVTNPKFDRACEVADALGVPLQRFYELMRG